MRTLATCARSFADGNVNTYPYSPGFGVTYYFTYVTLSSISYS